MGGTQSEYSFPSFLIIPGTFIKVPSFTVFVYSDSPGNRQGGHGYVHHTDTEAKTDEVALPLSQNWQQNPPTEA